MNSFQLAKKNVSDFHWRIQILYYLYVLLLLLAGATDRESDVVIRQVRQTTWPEVQRLFNTGLAGFWSMAVYLVVGFAACHITGPSVVMSVVITAITSVLTGKQIYKK